MTGRKASIVGALIGIGVVVQIVLGEAGLIDGPLLLLHMGIGYAGLVLALVYLYLSRVSKAAIAIAAVILLLVIAQVSLGTLLFTGSGTEGIERSHRFTGMTLLIVGIVGGVLAARLRRRASRV